MGDPDDTAPMRCTPVTRFRSLILVLCLGGAVTPGCDDPWARSRNSIILGIQQGDDRAALAEAQRMVREGPSSQRCEAAYLGGLAAYRLGDQAEAFRLLDIAVKSPDPTLRAEALVQRGSVAWACGRTREAARDLSQGGRVLGGEVGRTALERAATAYKTLDLEADARRCLEDASRLGTGPAPTSTRSVLAGYTIQFGAFGNRANAERLAERISRTVRSTGLGHVVIVQQGGLAKVQVEASYRDIMSAERAKSRLRLPSDVVASVTEVGR